MGTIATLQFWGFTCLLVSSKSANSQTRRRDVFRPPMRRPGNILQSDGMGPFTDRGGDINMDGYDGIALENSGYSWYIKYCST